MSASEYARGLVWLRNDLRLEDNTALYRAARACGELAAIYIACPETWASHGDGDNVVSFRLRSLELLQQRLRARGIPLFFVELSNFAQVPDALLQIVEKLRVNALFANAEYPLNELRRDQQVRSALKTIGVPVQYSSDRTLVPPGAIKTASGDSYKIFTPFKRTFLADFADQPFAPLPAPKTFSEDNANSWRKWIALAGPHNLVRDIPRKLNGYKSVQGRDGAVLGWAAGEPEALRRLQEFAEVINEYEQARDFPATEGTSMLSPYLNCGAISIRQCVTLALQYNRGQWVGRSDGANCWLGELLWREFYQHLVLNFPRVCRNKPFKPETENVPWAGDASGFRRWCAGNTGVPIVDAAMRQLNETGWMHNRLRMIVASFLTKNLLIDWRRGERYFMRQLIDADFAANNGGWQWAASTGTDAAPYFRVFNPYSQSRRFDSQGEFIRRYVPELASLSPKEIHCPPPREGYPLPMCDVVASRKRAIAVFAGLKSQPPKATN